MDDDVGAVFNGTAEVGGGKGGIHHKGNVVAVGDFCQLFKVGYVGIGVAESFDINRLGLVGYGRLKGSLLLRVDKGGGNAGG